MSNTNERVIEALLNQVDALQAENTQLKAGITPITPENYALCETQLIFADYLKKIIAATKTSGMGVFMHNLKGADPKDRAVMRINFDTLYSFAILDLAEEATLTMPETDNGRYQSAWLITEDHYNPNAFAKPGTYTLTEENMGTRYMMICMRTQVNVTDPKDIAAANVIQGKLALSQASVGSPYTASHKWDKEQMMKVRAKYMKMTTDKGYTSGEVFGKKGALTLEKHNCGTAFGWGGLTADQAAYPMYTPTSMAPQTLTLKDVPVKAFWSITVYDKEGYPQGDVYNINSAFAEADKGTNGTVFTIHFGGDTNAANYMDTFEGWNFALRLYLPTEEFFNGTWTQPELQVA